MSETAPELSFDRAVYATATPSPQAGSPSAAPAPAPCSLCKRPLEGEYWTWQQRILCEGCRGSLATTLAKSRSRAAFGRALLQGGGTALGCGIAYAVFVGISNVQFALATIGIGVVVATVIRRASGGVSGRRFQVLAVALTYVAATMGYAPGILKGLSESANDKTHTAADAASAHGGASSTAGAGTGAPSDPGASDQAATAEVSKETTDSTPKEKPMTLGNVALAITFLVGVTLAAPFLELTDAPLGALIILFGLWEAWRRSRGVPIVIDGPFRVALPPAPAVTAA